MMYLSLALLGVLSVVTQGLTLNENLWCRTAVTGRQVYKITFEWSIENFSFIDKQRGEYIESAEFSSDREPCRKWRMRLYPRAHRNHNSQYDVSLFLLFNDSRQGQSDVTAKFKVFAVDDTSKRIGNYISGVQPMKKGTEYGVHGFIKHNDLGHDDQNRRYGRLQNDTLKVVCELEVLLTQGSSQLTQRSGKVDVPYPEDQASRLSNDFARLLESGLGSDITFVVGEEEFKGHKAILAARSPVFASMLGPRNRLPLTGVSSDTFRQLLTYMYTGRLPEPLTSAFVLASEKFYLPCVTECGAVRSSSAKCADDQKSKSV